MWAKILTACGLVVGLPVGMLLAYWLLVELDIPLMVNFWVISFVTLFAHGWLGYFLGRKLDRGRSGK